MIEFPKHECSLTLQHNDNRDVYQTVAEWIADGESRDWHWDWVSPEQKAKAIATNEVWTLQWYPRTPIGCVCLAAADLDELLKAANKDELNVSD